MKPLLKKSTFAFLFGATAVAGIILTSCIKNKGESEENPVVLKDHSVIPVLVKSMSGFTNLKLYSLISSEDALSESPGFVFGGSADGSGIVKKPDGTGYITCLLTTKTTGLFPALH